MMITRHESHGSFAKQLLREGSMGGIAHVSHLHSHHAYSSGENLSPRSVLEQRALSGLAIAIDLEEKMKLLHTQENVMFGRCFSKQSIMHMGTQEARAKEGRSLSRERLNHMMCMHHDEREASSSVGLKVVIGIQQMGDGEGKAQEKPMMGRSLSRESMRQVMHVKEREDVGIRVGPSSGRERNKDYVCISEKKVGCSGDPPLKSPLSSSACRSSCKRGQSTWWLHELGHAQQSAPACASMEDSMFYYGPANPLPPPPAHHHCSVEDGCQACSPVEDFLKRCFFCKRRLGAGKDIYMYRGDQAFCSIECRCEQIARDECMGTSTL